MVCFLYVLLVVGGLLSGHLLAPRAGVTVEEGWPCQGPLLRLAVDVAERLLPGLQTSCLLLLETRLLHKTDIMSLIYINLNSLVLVTV